MKDKGWYIQNLGGGGDEISCVMPNVELRLYKYHPGLMRLKFTGPWAKVLITIIILIFFRSYPQGV